MKLDVIILAAGQGTRMQSALPKVLHPVAGKPLLQHVADSALALAPAACHVIVGYGAEQVQQSMSGQPLQWVEQAQQLGTGHAVLQALPMIDDDATVLVLFGDVPLVQPQTLKNLVSEAMEGPALLTAMVDKPHGYGRILRSKKGKLKAVVEERDASPEQRAIQEINTGILAMPAHQLKMLLPQVGNENAQGEYYLPDVLALAVREGLEVRSSLAASEIEILGVNDRVQLNRVEREFQYRQACQQMLAGVALADAHRLDVRGELGCGTDVSIDVNCVFEGHNQLGDGVRIGANCVLIDCKIGPGVEIKPFTHLEGAVLEADCVVGPFARLRPDTRLEAGARIGNFVETKKARIGAGSKVNHLSYIGDCDMGAATNIGAGTITCNYDGANKYLTRIGDGVFVGSNATLVAPVEIAAGGFVGAGSTITKPVNADQLAISRAKQRNLDGWNRPQKKDS